MILLALLALPASARALPGPEAMAAFEGNLRSGYSFVSVVSPSRDGKITLIARVTASYLYYQYPGARVISPGLSLGVGAGWRPARTAVSVMAGYEARYEETHRTTGPLAGRATHGVVLSADVYRQLSTYVAVAGSVSYGFSQDYLWGRIQATRQVYPPRGIGVSTFSLGVDATIRGNPVARGVDGGVFGQLAFPGVTTSFVLRVGVGRELPPEGDPRAQGVLGVSVYRSF